MNKLTPTGNAKIALIKRHVADFYRTTVEEIDGLGKTDPLPRFRHAAMTLAYEKTDLSMLDVARAFNRTGHRTIMHAVKANNRRRERERGFNHGFISLEIQVSAALNKYRSGFKV